MVGPSVGRSVGGLEGGEGDYQMAPDRPTDGPTVGPLVGRPVGGLRGGEIHTESCLREGDTGEKWNCRLVGRWDDWTDKQAE